MERLIRVVDEFDAGHIDKSRVRCQRDHGHHWTVTVEKKIAAPDTLEVDLHALISEWRDRNLNEMLHFDHVPIESVAAVVAERLMLTHPTIVRVEVSDGRITGIVTQESRR